jgi:hypothetical protein
MSLADVLAEDRRLIVLRALDEGDMHANETVLKQMVVALGHAPSREMIRGDLTFLAENRLIRLDKATVQTGELWIAHLTADGQDVARGRSYPGVARREPG